MEGLKNMMEEAVEYQLNRLLPTMPNICTCDICRLDMTAYALNRLSPQYVRTDTGALFQKVHNSSQQAEIGVITAVVSAAKVIGEHPHHD